MAPTSTSATLPTTTGAVTSSTPAARRVVQRHHWAVPIRGCLYRPALAGRAQALAALTSCVNTVRVKGAVVVLVGESGVGKTRLALEAARRAPDAGGVVLSGQATVFGTPPLGPLRRTLQFVAEQCVQGGAERLGQLLGNRARVLSPYEPTIGLAPGYDNAPALPSVSLPEARVRLFDGRIGKTGPLLGPGPADRSAHPHGQAH